MQMELFIEGQVNNLCRTNNARFNIIDLLKFRPDTLKSTAENNLFSFLFDKVFHYLVIYAPVVSVFNPFYRGCRPSAAITANTFHSFQALSLIDLKVCFFSARTYC